MAYPLLSGLKPVVSLFPRHCFPRSFEFLPRFMKLLRTGIWQIEIPLTAEISQLENLRIVVSSAANRGEAVNPSRKGARCNVICVFVRVDDETSIFCMARGDGADRSPLLGFAKRRKRNGLLLLSSSRRP